jgi:peptidoglycan/LPS O-acetylase OafA/YrhL
MVLINNAVFSTWIVGLVLGCFLILSVRPRKPGPLFSPAVTTELKGVAILMVIFSHIGYILASDSRFLWPFSIMAGVGVNLFFFLSGYGLSISNMKKKLGILDWYKKRLPKLFIPLWIVVSIFLLMDYFILHTHYPFQYIWHSMLGFFPRADAQKDLDSVLWYLTPLLFYYLLFPLVFSKKHLWISAVVLFLISILFVRWGTSLLPGVVRLYKVHYCAFPLGVLAAWAFSTTTAGRLRRYVEAQGKKLTSKKSKNRMSGLLARGLYCLLILALMLTIGHLAVHSGVGQSPDKEQFISLCTMALTILLFIIKRVEFKFLSLFGLFSYEIYLLHWPLVSRYDLLYKHTYAWLATLAWLGIFIVLSWFLSSIAAGNFKFKWQTRSSK